MAKAVAAFQACVALYKAGFMDDDLNPTRTEAQIKVGR